MDRCSHFNIHFKVSPCQSICNGLSPTNGFCSRIYVLAFSIRNVRFLTEFNLIILVERRRVRGLESVFFSFFLFFLFEGGVGGWSFWVSSPSSVVPSCRACDWDGDGVGTSEWRVSSFLFESQNSFHRNAVVLDNEFSPTSIRLVDS